MTPHQTFFKSDQPSRVDKALKRKAEDDRRWRDVCKLVDTRDDRACRACGKKANADAVGLLRGHRHHVVYRSAGGSDDSSNLCTLCAEHHNDEHLHRLRIEGNADEKLTFWKLDPDCGTWFVWRRETAVRVFEKD